MHAALTLSSSSLLRRWPLLLLVVVLPILLVGLFFRVAWTPDEPRELALAWQMTQQADWSVPRLGDEAFCEKPPLLYWTSGACMWALGKSPAVARIPNLLFALIGIFSVALLARSMVARRGGTEDAAHLAALAAGVVMASMELTWQVFVWLASDAPLLMGVCVAFLGAWKGAQAGRGRSKLCWYSVMHAGMLVGFFSKNIIGWIVPGLAFAAWILWERRWRELLRWELWAAFPVQLLAIGGWSWAVWRGPEGAEHLRIFYVENLIGRFLPQYRGTMDYNSGHQNWPGKYLVELPVYLLPWLLLCVAALRRALPAAWRLAPADGAGSAWRFALCIIVPNLLLLSVASTGRGIYLAPLMAGFALLVGMWAADRLLATSDPLAGLDGWAFRWTILLMPVLALLLAIGGLVLQVVSGLPWDLMLVMCAICCVVLGVVKWVALRGYLKRQLYGEAIRDALITLMAVWVLAFISVPRFLDKSYDLEAVARFATSHDGEAVLLEPDETTVAALSYHAGLSLLRISRVQEAEAQRRPAVRALCKMPKKEAAYQEALTELARRGWRAVGALDLPCGGRRYVLLAPAAGGRP